MRMPFIDVLRALKTELAQALDGRTVGGKAVTVRHFRHRESTIEEWPCIAIRYVSNDASSYGRQETNDGLPEQVMELAVDLVIDLELPAEATDENDDDIDPTGFECAGNMLAWALDALLPGEESNTLGGTTWEIRYDGTAPDEGVQSPDLARLEERIVLLYRVRADQPTILLMGN